MRIATWNINSIRARQQRLLDWLDREEPDVLCLQELKAEQDALPVEALRQAGYHCQAFGQRTYNGVALLSRTELTDVRKGFSDPDADTAARLISARMDGVQLASVYVPNGGTLESPKYAYKRAWLKHFVSWLGAELASGTPMIVSGDFNVAPDDLDVHFPERWADSVLCAPQVRAAFQEMLALGLVDIFRLHHPEGGVYSWWDYRQLAFPKNDGLRIDHILASPSLAPKFTRTWIDRDERKGSKPSDHAPVVAEVEL